MTQLSLPAADGGLVADRIVGYVAAVPRIVGARLAVPLAVIPLAATLSLVVPEASAADDGCRPTPDGISCSFSGSIRSGGTRPAPGGQPPLRYLATSGGSCWYWARHGPGLDSWNSANDQAIILTRLRLPRCRGRTVPATPSDASARAWQVFRSFPLDAPHFRLSPAVGITNLPTRLHLAEPRGFRHGETLPDGRHLEVVAQATAVWVDWGDGSPPSGGAPAVMAGDPGSARHTYALKTCPPEYRSEHLDGPKCHPSLEDYAVVVVLQWEGRYRTGGAWQALGSIDRSHGVGYDVDEVLGVLVEP